MNRRLLLLGMLMLILISANALADEEPVIVPVVSTTPSTHYPEVTCTTSDAASSADILQMAADTRDNLAPLLRLGPHWRFPVHIHLVTSDDPLAQKIQGEGVAAVASDKNLEIEAALPASDPDAREFIQRQFVTAILWEKFFPKDQTFDTHTRLDIVPLWLIEGLREWLNDDPEHNRESIVKRAAQTGRTPTLDEIASWQDLSNDRLLGLWQRAFSYYLVNSLIRTADQREDFQQWLATMAGPNPSSAKLLFPTEAGWERELQDAPDRSQDIVYTWDETAAELTADETVTLASEDEEGKVTTCALSDVAGLPLSKRLIEALEQKNFVLTALELRAHPSWRPVIALYRFGITALLTDKEGDRAEMFLAQARQRRDAEMDYHQKLTDYANWFEVTHDYMSTDSRFRSYFSVARNLERAEADHPNPIRANLLQVESQL